MCARGAIQVATGLIELTGRRSLSFGGDENVIADLAERSLLEQINTNFEGANKFANVPGWNDNKAEDVHEVREQMLLAAKNLRNSISVEA